MPDLNRMARKGDLHWGRQNQNFFDGNSYRFVLLQIIESSRSALTARLRERRYSGRSKEVVAGINSNLKRRKRVQWLERLESASNASITHSVTAEIEITTED